MIVCDASVVVDLLLGGPRAEAVLPWLESEEGEIHAPGLLDVETLHALRRLVSTGVMDTHRGRAGMEILQDLPIERHPERLLLPRLWSLRENLSAYDATYVALAEALGCPLLTGDAGLARAPGLPVQVELVAPR